MIAALSLARRSTTYATLADGTRKQVDHYDADVYWDGAWKPVLVYEISADPLLRMRMLAGHSLRVDVVPGGMVEITRLP